MVNPGDKIVTAEGTGFVYLAYDGFVVAHIDGSQFMLWFNDGEYWVVS